MTKFLVSMQSLLNSLRAEDEGATAVEYGLIVTLIAVAIIGGVTALGLALNGQFNAVAGAI